MPGFLDNLFNPSDLYNAMKERNILPDWAQTLPYSGSLGEYLVHANKLIANRPDNDTRKSTVSHEMTHAVQYNLLRSMLAHINDRQWENQEVSPQEEQYQKAAQTLFTVQPGRIGQYDRQQADTDMSSQTNMLKRLYPKPENMDEHRYYSYRSKPTEAQAFGVGNMSTPTRDKDASPGNPHYDPTMATEFSILLNMYKQLPKQLQDEALVKRREEIKQSRNTDVVKREDEGYNYKAPTYTDPFLEQLRNSLTTTTKIKKKK